MGVEVPEGFNLSVESIQLNQGNQRLDGTIGGVAGRAGVLRILVKASHDHRAAPRVRVRLYDGGTLLREAAAHGGGSGVMTAPDVERWSETWNLHVDAAEMVEGLEVEVLVDPDGTFPDADPADNRYPVSGRASLDVRPLPPLEVAFFPVHVPAADATGQVDPDSLLAVSKRLIPISDVQYRIGGSVTATGDPSEDTFTSTLLSDLLAIRTAEGATDEYYAGIFPNTGTLAWGGRAFVPGGPEHRAVRALVSQDRLPSASGTFAHELGHNLGRPHVPCGDPSNPDPDYPYAEGGIGVPGYDPVRQELMDPDSGYVDYMSYCGPKWTSDYTFGAVVDWRRSELQARSVAPTRVPGLLLWGRIGPEGPILNPVLSLEAPPSLPSGTGPYVLRGSTADGAVLFEESFAGATVADAPGGDERQFAFFVPLPAAEQAALAGVELIVPGEPAVRREATPRSVAGGPGPEVHVMESTDGAELTWDPARFPVAMVRDPATGEVLAFGRGGTATIPAASPGAEVLLSDGVRTTKVGLH